MVTYLDFRLLWGLVLPYCKSIIHFFKRVLSRRIIALSFNNTLTRESELITVPVVLNLNNMISFCYQSDHYFNYEQWSFFFLLCFLLHIPIVDYLFVVSKDINGRICLCLYECACVQGKSVEEVLDIASHYRLLSIIKTRIIFSWIQGKTKQSVDMNWSKFVFFSSSSLLTLSWHGLIMRFFLWDNYILTPVFFYPYFHGWIYPPSPSCKHMRFRLIWAPVNQSI